MLQVLEPAITDFPYFCLAFGHLLAYFWINVIYEEVELQDLKPKWQNALIGLNAIYPEPADLAQRIGCSLNTAKRWLSHESVPKRKWRTRIILVLEEEMREPVNQT